MRTTQTDTDLELVSDSQRRRIIHQLREQSAGELTVADLVDHLHDDEPVSLDDKRPDREQLTLQLVHNHLPKLDEHGIIHYDQKNKLVRYQPNDDVETVLDALPTELVQPSADSSAIHN